MLVPTTLVRVLDAFALGHDSGLLSDEVEASVAAAVRKVHAALSPAEIPLLLSGLSQVGGRAV